MTSLRRKFELNEDSLEYFEADVLMAWNERFPVGILLKAPQDRPEVGRVWPESGFLFVSDELSYIAKDDTQSGGR